MTVALAGAVSRLSLLAPGMVVAFADTGGVWNALALPLMGPGLTSIVNGLPLSLAVEGVVTGRGVFLWK